MLKISDEQGTILADAVKREIHLLHETPLEGLSEEDRKWFKHRVKVLTTTVGVFDPAGDSVIETTVEDGVETSYMAAVLHIDSVPLTMAVFMKEIVRLVKELAAGRPHGEGIFSELMNEIGFMLDALGQLRQTLDAMKSQRAPISARALREIPSTEEAFRLFDGIEGIDMARVRREVEAEEKSFIRLPGNGTKH